MSGDIDEDYRIVFTGEHGERVLRHLMACCCMWESTINPDPHATAYNEGRRTVVLGIIDRVRVKWSPQELAHEITQSQVDYHQTRPPTDPSAQGT